MTNQPTNTTTYQQLPNTQDSQVQSIQAQIAACDDLPVHWVDKQQQLDTLVDLIDAIDTVALDTEFIRRNTFYPILALVQVNTGEGIYLIDAPKLDLSEFWQALIEIPEMVWYACGEDLGIFYSLVHCDALTNVFDVQIGVAYLTGQWQMGYARALTEILALTVDKSESQSDWLIRPLSDNQKRYAADDVRYLLMLHRVVQDKLAQKSLTAFVQEDTQLYVQELYQLQHCPDDRLYLDYLAPIYNHEQVAVLQALVAWRVQVARATNVPTSFVISKQALREIVLALPQTIKDLARTTIHRQALRIYGDEIIRLIDTARRLPIHDRPPMPRASFYGKNKSYQPSLKQAIAEQACRLQTFDEILFKNRWLDTLLYVAISDDMTAMPEGLKGYRYAWVVNVLLPLLKEHKASILQNYEQNQRSNCP